MFDINTFDIQKFDTILNKGLSKGLGKTDTQMCIEAAICQTLGLPHGDDPKCVTESVRTFKIRLNDSNWSSPEARAKGLRNLGLAQLGSLGVVNDADFSRKLSLLTIQQLIPALFREVFPDNKECLDAAEQCELAVDIVVARTAARAAATTTARAARAAYADAAAYAARVADAAAYADHAAAAAAAYNVDNSDKYLIMLANFALQVLKELNSPGCKLLDT